MTTRSARAGDWIAIAAEQARFCRLTHGTQIAIGNATVPFTPGTFAFQTFAFWNGAMDPVFFAAGQEGKLDGPAMAAVAGLDLTAGMGSTLFLGGTAAAVGRATSSAAVRQAATRVDSALRVMLSAMSAGSSPGTRNGRGLLCLDAVQAPRFWEAVASLGREYSFLAAGTSITVEEYWEAVKEGAVDGLRNVGEVAGSALAAAGEGLGTAVSGFLTGLGALNVVLLAGGAYVVGRKIL
jgi:hypothetical protein